MSETLTDNELSSLEKVATLRGKVGLLKRSIEMLPRYGPGIASDFCDEDGGCNCYPRMDEEYIGEWISRTDVLALFAVVNEP